MQRLGRTKSNSGKMKQEVCHPRKLGGSLL